MPSPAQNNGRPDLGHPSDSISEKRARLTERTKNMSEPALKRNIAATEEQLLGIRKQFRSLVSKARRSEQIIEHYKQEMKKRNRSPGKDEIIAQLMFGVTEEAATAFPNIDWCFRREGDKEAAVGGEGTGASSGTKRAVAPSATGSEIGSQTGSATVRSTPGAPSSLNDNDKETGDLIVWVANNGEETEEGETQS